MKGLLHSLFGKMNLPRYQYDAFISHAVEDKLPIANELCARLEEAGLRIWYSGRELSVGDRVSDSIEEGLRKSRFGVVILSPTYLQKNWTMREFYSLLSRGEYGKVILPVLFEITPEELLAKDITMADTFALRAEKGMDYLVESLSAAIQREKHEPSRREYSGRGRVIIGALIGILLLAIAGVAGFFSLTTNSVDSNSPLTPEIGKQLIFERLREIDSKASQVVQEQNYFPVTMVTQVEKDANEYTDLKTHYRNEYRLDNGFMKVQSKKNVEAILGIDFDSVNLLNNYRLHAPEVLRFETISGGRTLYYVHRNISPVSFTIESMNELSNGTWIVDVRFSNNVRLVETVLYFPDLKDKEPRKRHQLRMIAMLPAERYLVRKQGRTWALEYYPNP